MPGLPLTCPPQEPGISTVYNDIEPFCCQWLRNLIAAGHLPQGDVIEGDFREIAADDIPETAHFFAGIGGWPYALELAGWQGPVWTASLPCQPLSSAGQRRGHNDERHLWPAFHSLVAERRPAAIFGEQVASKDGREWFAGIRHDLESLGYACGAADLPAASVGAPHIRQRLFWVANANDGAACGMAHANGGHCSAEGLQRSGQHGQQPEDSTASRLGDTARPGPQRSRTNDRAQGSGRAAGQPRLPSAATNFWTNCDWLLCTDGKARRVESGSFPLAHGVSNRVGRLRAYGNAIVPQVAAEFVRAFMECR